MPFIVLHHLIADGWSRGVLLRDLARAYRLASNQAWDDDGAMMGQSLDTIHYSVFHADQEWGKSQEKVHQLSYWTQQLDGMKLLEIPTDRPSPAKATFASQTLTRTLSRDLTEKIHNLGREHGATLFMTLLAGIQVPALSLYKRTRFGSRCACFWSTLSGVCRLDRLFC